MPIDIYCDGLVEPVNPGGWACWSFVAMNNGKTLHSDSGCLGQGEGMTNNIAEYESVLRALLWAYKNKHTAPRIYSDSQLVVCQVSGKYKCNKPYLAVLRERVRKGLSMTGGTLEWVPRERNEIADGLTREAYHAARYGHPQFAR